MHAHDVACWCSSGLDDNSGRRDLQAKLMILHCERLGPGSHARWISVGKRQSWSVVFENGGDGAYLVCQIDIKNLVDLKKYAS